MFKEFIGRNVEMSVAFSTSSTTGSTPPVRYLGVVKDVTDNTVKLSLISSTENFPAKKFNGELIEFNSKFIIYIKEVL